MRKISKLLSIVLCLSLVMGLAIVANAADLSGTYILGDTKEDGTQVAGKAVSESKDFGYLYEAEVTTDNTRIQYTIAKSGSGYTITDCYGRLLGVSGDYTSFQLTETGDAALWNITASGDKFIVTNVSNGKTIDFSEHNPILKGRPASCSALALLAKAMVVALGVPAAVKPPKPTLSS